MGVKPSESRNLQAMEGSRRLTKPEQTKGLPGCTLAPPHVWARATQAQQSFELELWNPSALLRLFASGGVRWGGAEARPVGE